MSDPWREYDAAEAAYRATLVTLRRARTTRAQATFAFRRQRPGGPGLAALAAHESAQADYVGAYVAHIAMRTAYRTARKALDAARAVQTAVTFREWGDGATRNSPHVIEDISQPARRDGAAHGWIVCTCLARIEATDDLTLEEAWDAHRGLTVVAGRIASRVSGERATDGEVADFLDGLQDGRRAAPTLFGVSVEPDRLDT